MDFSLWTRVLYHAGEIEHRQKSAGTCLIIVSVLQIECMGCFFNANVNGLGQPSILERLSFQNKGFGISMYIAFIGNSIDKVEDTEIILDLSKYAL